MSDKYPGYKKCFVDVETTGTDRKLNHIWQIAGEITDVNDNTLEKFNFKFMPFSLEHASEEALEKTNTSIAKLCELGDPRKGYKAFTDVLGRHCDKFDSKDKLQMIAYRAEFDNDFLREFFALNGDKYFGSWFWTPPICVMQMAAAFLERVRGALPNFQLATLCQSAGLGWDPKRAHDAEYDITQTKRLYQYIRENTRILGE